MPPQDQQINLTIHLLPEFGWAIDGEPVYGPGSVFQGFVRVELPAEQPHGSHEEIDRLRVLFHGSEALALSEITNHHRSPKCAREQFFGTQRILWCSKGGAYSDANGRLQDFPFTVQLPQVQFPPSMQIENLYCCKYRLTAYLETREGKSLAVDECPLSYVPLVETRATKSMQPFVVSKSCRSDTAAARVELESLDYAAGDSITPRVSFPSDSRYHMTLLRTVITRNANKRHQTTVVAESAGPLLLSSHLIPSVSYGRLTTVEYSLRISVYAVEPTTARASLLSRLRRPSASVTFDDIPIRIGTLGYGIRPPSDLVPYTDFKSVFDKSPNNALPPLPVPQFLTALEYKDSLPAYEGYELPSYEEDMLSQKTVDTCGSNL